MRDIRTWNTIYHHGFMDNPFEALVEQTFANTRSKYGNKYKPVPTFTFEKLL